MTNSAVTNSLYSDPSKSSGPAVEERLPRPISANDEGEAGLIRVSSGLHANAEFICRPLDMVVIGTGEDCDMVLSDPQIARHHCLVVLGQEGYLVRALDAPVQVQGMPLNPGEQLNVPAGAAIELADVTVGLHPHLTVQLETSDQRRMVLMGLFAVLTVAALLGIWVWYAEQGSTQLQQIEALPAPGAGTTEQSTHRDLAGQVSEILRLSGLQAQTRNLVPGQVEVSGHFNNDGQLENIIHSRAMQDIRGLQQVVVRNLADSPKSTPQHTDDKEIARVITGTDPYVVTRDNARYYPGAELADGRRIVRIEHQGVVVISSTGEEQLLEPGSPLF